MITLHPNCSAASTTTTTPARVPVVMTSSSSSPSLLKNNPPAPSSPQEESGAGGTPPPSLLVSERDVPRCGQCGRSDSVPDAIYLMECSGCLNVYYCSREHQLLHWPSHKPACRAVQLKPHVLLVQPTVYQNQSINLTDGQQSAAPPPPPPPPVVSSPAMDTSTSTSSLVMTPTTPPPPCSTNSSTSNSCSSASASSTTTGVVLAASDWSSSITTTASDWSSSLSTNRRPSVIKMAGKLSSAPSSSSFSSMSTTNNINNTSTSPQCSIKINDDQHHHDDDDYGDIIVDQPEKSIKHERLTNGREDDGKVTATGNNSGHQATATTTAGHRHGRNNNSSHHQQHHQQHRRPAPAMINNNYNKAECLSLTTIPERRATFGTADLHRHHQKSAGASTGGGGGHYGGGSAAGITLLDDGQHALFASLAHPSQQIGVAPELAYKMTLSDPPNARKFDHNANPRINLATDPRFKITPPPQSSNTNININNNNSATSSSSTPLVGPATATAGAGGAGPAGSSHLNAATNRRDQLIVRTFNIARCASLLLQHYGWVVFDNFLGPSHAQRVYNEVKDLYETPGKFTDGQLVKTKEGSSTLDVRSDKIYWFDNWLDQRVNIGFLISMIDSVVGNMPHFPYTIEGRCKPMIACYPGSGAKYVQHVDNPDKDGRLITAIYYLNANWTKEIGGILRLLPTTACEPVDIEPVFDRLILFWSDKRNPHEVLPSYGMRFAVTIWYFDKDERAKFFKSMTHSRTSSTSANQQSPQTDFMADNIFHSSAVGGSVDQLNRLQYQKQPHPPHPFPRNQGLPQSASSSFFNSSNPQQQHLSPEAAAVFGSSQACWGLGGMGSRVPSLREMSQQHHDVVGGEEICINLNGMVHHNHYHPRFSTAPLAGAVSASANRNNNNSATTAHVLEQAANQLTAMVAQQQQPPPPPPIIDEDPQEEDCQGRRNTLDLGHFQRRANARGVYHGLPAAAGAGAQTSTARAPYYFGRKSMATVLESRSPENEPA